MQTARTVHTTAVTTVMTTMAPWSLDERAIWGPSLLEDMVIVVKREGQFNLEEGSRYRFHRRLGCRCRNAENFDLDLLLPKFWHREPPAEDKEAWH